MKAEYLNPFIVSTVEILKQFGVNKVEKGELKLVKGGVKINKTAIVIGIAGEISGRVIYDMDLDTCLHFAELLMGEELKEFNEIVKSAIGEFANMITGKAITLLHEQGIKFKISPPTLFTGKDMEITDMDIPALVVPLKTEKGTITINLALKEQK